MLSSSRNLTRPWVVIGSHVEVAPLIPHTAFMELMPRGVILDDHTTAIISREVIFTSLDRLLVLIEYRISPLISHRHTCNFHRVLSRWNTQIALCPAERGAATRELFVRRAFVRRQAQRVGPGVGVVDVGGRVGGGREPEGVGGEVAGGGGVVVAVVVVVEAGFGVVVLAGEAEGGVGGASVVQVVVPHRVAAGAPGDLAFSSTSSVGVPTRSVTMAKKRESISRWVVASVMRSVWAIGLQAVVVPGQGDRVGRDPVRWWSVRRAWGRPR